MKSGISRFNRRYATDDRLRVEFVGCTATVNCRYATTNFEDENENEDEDEDD